MADCFKLCFRVRQFSTPGNSVTPRDCLTGLDLVSWPRLRYFFLSGFFQNSLLKYGSCSLDHKLNTKIQYSEVNSEFVYNKCSFNVSLYCFILQIVIIHILTVVVKYYQVIVTEFQWAMSGWHKRIHQSVSLVFPMKPI